MKIGDIITSEGRKRKIIAFTTVNGEQKPVTEIYNEEVVEEVPVAEEPKGASIEYTCQYCGKVCASDLGRIAHERHCARNPENINKKEK